MACPSAGHGNRSYTNSKKEDRHRLHNSASPPGSQLYTSPLHMFLHSETPPPATNFLLVPVFSSPTCYQYKLSLPLHPSITSKLPMKMEQIVFRNVGIYKSVAGGITQKNTHYILNTAKAWNQGLTDYSLRNILPTVCGLPLIGSSVNIITLVLMMPRGIITWRANIHLAVPLPELSRSGKIGFGVHTASGDCFSRGHVQITLDFSLPIRS